jgi:hypothetical protein
VLRLVELRDQNQNRNAAVSAIKTLEMLGDDMPQHAAAQAARPGLVILVTGGAGPPPRTIEHNATPNAPAIDVTPDRSAVLALNDRTQQGRRQVGPGPRKPPPE